MSGMSSGGWNNLPGSEPKLPPVDHKYDAPNKGGGNVQGHSGSWIENGQVWQLIPELDADGEPTGKMVAARVANAPGSSGGGHSNDALVAAQAALSGFLQAQTLADARKSAAMDQFQKLAQWAVPDGAQYAPNFEPGGLANEAAAVAGMQKFMPPKLQTARINAGTIQNPGTVPPEILDMIGAIRGAAGQGKDG